MKNAVHALPVLTLALCSMVGSANLFLGGICLSQETPDSRRSAAIAKWDDEIRRLESLAQQQHPPEGAILLLGSSSIRLWDTADEDLAPYPVIRRGYGGARYSDLSIFASRLVSLHDFRALVIFVANDVTGATDDPSVSQVRQWVEQILATARRHQQDAEIFLVEITPTPARWGSWAEIRAVNAMLRDVALVTPKTHFISTAEYYLDPRAEPRADLFGEDRLHLNREGYRQWGKLIRRQLADFVPLPSGQLHLQNASPEMQSAAEVHR